MGLSPDEWGVDKSILEKDYMLTVAYLDTSVREKVENEIFSVMMLMFQRRLRRLKTIGRLD